jgi:hypothetical protein
MSFTFIQHCAEKIILSKFGDDILKVLAVTLKLTDKQEKYNLSLTHGAVHNK